MEAIRADSIEMKERQKNMEEQVSMLQRLYDKMIMRVDIIENKIDTLIQETKNNLANRKKLLTKTILSIVVGVIVAMSGWIYNSIEQTNKIVEKSKIRKELINIIKKELNNGK